MDITEVEGATFYCADALEVLRHLPDNSIDLIATDPPYYRVKGLAWDRAWNTADGFLAWIGQLTAEWQRVLKANGSLYCFASPKMAARVEVEIGKQLDVLHQIVWVKPDPFSSINRGAGNGGRMCKETMRSYYPNTERIIFAEQYGADNAAKGGSGYETIRQYLDKERCSLGWKLGWLNGQFGFAVTGSGWARDTFTRLDGGWNMITEENYVRLQTLAEGRAFLRLYNDLRNEYEVLYTEYERRRRFFSVTAEVPYTDVWDFKTVPHRPGKHICEKPLDLCEHIILASSRPGSVVLDSFVGSGAFGHAAVKHGRTFIGSDNDPHWIAKAADRIRKINAVEPEKRDYQQMDLVV